MNDPVQLRQSTASYNGLNGGWGFTYVVRTLGAL